MGNRVIEFKVYAANMVRRGVMEAKAELASLKSVASGVHATFRAFGTALGWVRDQALKLAAGVAVAGAALAVTVQKAFTFEKYTLQFKILFGNMEAAKKHMAELADFAARTPFELEGIVEASRLLMTFSEGVLGTESSLRLVGDAAAATGQGLSEVALWVGRAYSMIAAGKPFGEAAMRLQEMGVLTAKARNEMEELQAKGASAGDVFGVLTRSLGRFSGGMEELAKSGDGLVSTLKDNVNLALKDFGEVFMEDAKNALKSLIGWLDKLRADGTITEWAKKAREAIGLAAEVAKAIMQGGDRRSKALEGLKDIIIGAFQFAAGKAAELLMKAAPVIGDLIGKGAKAAINSVATEKRFNQARDQLVAEGKIEKHTGRTLAFGRRSSLLETGRSLGTPEADAWYKAVEDRMAEDDRKKLQAMGSSAIAGSNWTSRGQSRMKRGFAALQAVAGDKTEEERQAAADYDATQSRQDRIDAIKKSIAGAKPELVQAGIDAFKALVEGMEESGSGAGSGKWRAQFDQFQKDRQTEAEQKAVQDAALNKAEADRRKKAMDQIGIMAKSTPSGQGALDAAKKAVAEDYKREGMTLNQDKAKPWEDVLAKMKDLLEKSPAAIAGKKSDLLARQEAFKMSLLSPAEQLKARRGNVADLEKKIGAERDPEKVLNLRSKLQDELEAIQGLKTAGAGKKTRSLDVGEIYTRMYGQDVGKRDPAERAAKAAEETAAILKRIEQKKGGLAP